MSSAGHGKKSRIDVAYVARLARLNLTDEEKTRLGRQLDSILDYVDKLNEVETETAEPTSHVLPLENVYREDGVSGALPVEETLKNAPSRQGNFFKVPRVIE